MILLKKKATLKHGDCCPHIKVDFIIFERKDVDKVAWEERTG